VIKTIKSSFWYLPSEVRRKLAPVLMRDKYEHFHEKCHREAENPYGSTLQPFIDHKCIFVHVPKSAGLSVTNSLFGTMTGSHMKIVEYQTMFTKEEFDQFFKFAFVRNPWDRVVSAFLYLKRGGFGERDRVWATENLAAYNDFDAFAKQWLNEENARLHLHFTPQYPFIYLPGKRKPAVDFVGYFENLEADYYFIREKIGVGKELQVKNVTKDRHRDHRQYYSEKTKRIVADIYRKDIELFGYDFDNHWTSCESHGLRASSTL
jgi:hypothetical protein